MTAGDRFKVVITQSGDRGRQVTELLRAQGIAAVHVPLIETVPVTLENVSSLPPFVHRPVDGYILTSATAARIFVSLVAEHPNWNWGRLLCYCIGDATAAACREARLSTVVYPGVADAASLADALIQRLSVPSRLAFVRGVQARSTVSMRLTQAGHEVVDVVVYDTRPIALTDNVDWTRLSHERRLLWVLFSPSGVQSLLQNDPDFRTTMNLLQHRVMAFGTTTRQALVEAKIEVGTVSSSTTHEGLVHTVKEYLATLGDK